VTIYKLVTDGTVDARILDLGKRKAEVNAALLDGDESAPKGKRETQSMSSMLKDALKSFLS